MCSHAVIKKRYLKPPYLKRYEVVKSALETLPLLLLNEMQKRKEQEKKFGEVQRSTD